MGRDVCEACGCCNHCGARHEDSAHPVDYCPLDPEVPQERIVADLIKAGYDPELENSRVMIMLDLAEEKRRLQNEAHDAARLVSDWTDVAKAAEAKLAAAEEQYKKDVVRHSGELATLWRHDRHLHDELTRLREVLWALTGPPWSTADHNPGLRAYVLDLIISGRVQLGDEEKAALRAHLGELRYLDALGIADRQIMESQDAVDRETKAFLDGAASMQDLVKGLQAQVKHLLADIEHLRHEPGPDSCAGFCVRHHALEASLKPVRAEIEQMAKPGTPWEVVLKLLDRGGR